MTDWAPVGTIIASFHGCESGVEIQGLGESFSFKLICHMQCARAFDKERLVLLAEVKPSMDLLACRVYHYLVC